MLGISRGTGFLKYLGVRTQQRFSLTHHKNHLGHVANPDSRPHHRIPESESPWPALRMHTPSESYDRGCLGYTTHSDLFKNKSLFGSISLSLPTPSLLPCKTILYSFLDKHTHRLTLMTERLFSPEDYQWIEYKLAEENSFSLSKPTCKSGLYNACKHFGTL